MQTFAIRSFGGTCWFEFEVALSGKLKFDSSFTFPLLSLCSTLVKARRRLPSFLYSSVPADFFAVLQARCLVSASLF